MTTNKIYVSKIDILYYKFHEFWCSHLSCRIFNFSPRKTFSNEYLECIILKNSSKQSRWILYSYIFEHKREDMEYRDYIYYIYILCIYIYTQNHTCKIVQLSSAKGAAAWICWRCSWRPQWQQLRLHIRAGFHAGAMGQRGHVHAAARTSQAMEPGGMHGCHGPHAGESPGRRQATTHWRMDSSQHVSFSTKSTIQGLLLVAASYK